MDEKIAPHLEELTRALGDLEKTGIRAEFEKLIAFRVPPDVAKESILRKFGGKRKFLKVKDLLILRILRLQAEFWILGKN